MKSIAWQPEIYGDMLAVMFYFSFVKFSFFQQMKTFLGNIQWFHAGYSSSIFLKSPIKSFFLIKHVVNNLSIIIQFFVGNTYNGI